MSEDNGTSLTVFLFFLASLQGLAYYILSRTKTKHQKLMEREPPNQTRPVFQIETDRNIHPRMRVNNDPNLRQFAGRLRNTGGIANSVRVFYNFVDHQIGLAEIRQQKNSICQAFPPQDLAGIPTNDSINVISEKVSWTPERGQMWMVMWIEYTLADNVQEDYVISLHVNGESVPRDNIRYFPHDTIHN